MKELITSPMFDIICNCNCVKGNNRRFRRYGEKYGSQKTLILAYFAQCIKWSKFAFLYVILTFDTDTDINFKLPQKAAIFRLCTN